MYVNEAPQITSTNKLKILVGDTLTHFIAAKDQTKKNELTFSIRTTIKEMFLNANTGEINWTPKIDFNRGLKKCQAVFNKIAFL